MGYININMTIEEIYKKRKQTKKFDEVNIPDRNLIKSLIDKTFELTASKQNLMPYKVFVLGPEHKKLKREFENIILETLEGGENNRNVSTSPYTIMFTHRLVTPNDVIKERIAKGHIYKVCDKNWYRWQKREVSIEVGMFAKVLTGLCIENNIDVAYLLCFPSYEEHQNLYNKFSFSKEPIVFSMQLGYKDKTVHPEYRKDRSLKPKIDDVIKWID